MATNTYDQNTAADPIPKYLPTPAGGVTPSRTALIFSGNISCVVLVKGYVYNTWNWPRTVGPDPEAQTPRT